MKIVVVDDDNLVALSLKTILESSGRMEVAALGHSGKEGLHFIKVFCRMCF